ncbi:ATP-binding protein [Kitasatospora sp. NPDC101801]|uniref:ATP-binding protein n=1 Tax=Kitasatospora sp. NPDC101801 TaxID=3364103 RepID=UPI0037FF567F
MTSIQAPADHLVAPASNTWIRGHQPTAEADVPQLRAAVGDHCRSQAKQADRSVDELALFMVGLVATELLSNAIRHTTGTSDRPAAGIRPSVALLAQVLEDGRILIAVSDCSPAGPNPKLVDRDEAEGGRGLKIVHEITHACWGWHPLPSGKSIWAICPNIFTVDTAA